MDETLIDLRVDAESWRHYDAPVLGAAGGAGLYSLVESPREVVKIK